MATYKILVGSGMAIAAVGGVTVYGQKLTQQLENRKEPLKPDQISFYRPPSNKEYYIEEKVTPVLKLLKSTRLSIRSSLDPYTDEEGRHIIDKLSDKWGVAKAHTADLIEQIKSDPENLRNSAIISIAGLAGASLGFRGGLFRRLTYGSVAMVVTGSLLYPEQAVSIGSSITSRISQKVTDTTKTITDKAVSVVTTTTNSINDFATGTVEAAKKSLDSSTEEVKAKEEEVKAESEEILPDPDTGETESVDSVEQPMNASDPDQGEGQSGTQTEEQAS